MHVLYILISAAIQGVTEFVPVSSSGHLVIWHSFVASPVNPLLLDIMLHFGSVIALIVYFRKDIVRLLRAWLGSFAGKTTTSSQLAWWLIVSTIPAGIAGYFLEDMITQVFRSTWWVVGMLIGVALLMWLIERISLQVREEDELKFKDALLIGLAQCIALIPGTSRSGITIITGMMLKLKRAAAARYSFLLAIPTLGGASLKGLIDLSKMNLQLNELILFSIGLIASFVFSILVIKHLLRYLQRGSLIPFAWYRIALAVIVLLVLSV